jgi:hypothetical protein
LSEAKASARAVLAGRIANEIAKAPRRETLLGCAHITYETACPVVSLTSFIGFKQKSMPILTDI